MMFGGKPKNDSDPIRNPNAGTRHDSWTRLSQAQKTGRWGSSRSEKPKGWGR